MTTLEKIDLVSRGLLEFKGLKTVTINISQLEAENLDEEIREEFCDCGTVMYLDNQQVYNVKSLRIYGINFHFNIVEE